MFSIHLSLQQFSTNMSLYHSSGTRHRHSFSEIVVGTYTCPTQRCYFEWSWVTWRNIYGHEALRSISATAELLVWKLVLTRIPDLNRPMTWGPDPNPNGPTGRGIIWKLTLTHIPDPDLLSILYTLTVSLYIDWRMVVVVGGGNVLHHVKRGNCPGGGNVRGETCPGEYVQGGECPDHDTVHVFSLAVAPVSTRCCSILVFLLSRFNAMVADVDPSSLRCRSPAPPRSRTSPTLSCFLTDVSRIRSGPRLVGRIGSVYGLVPVCKKMPASFNIIN